MFNVAENVLTTMNMKEAVMVHGKCSWFNELWEVEKVDIKHLAYVPLRRTIVGEDGDCEVLEDHDSEKCESFPSPCQHMLKVT